MVYKRYQSPFESTSEEHKKPTTTPKDNEPVQEQVAHADAGRPQSTSSFGFLDGLASDDIILIGLIVILLAENKEKRDVPLILTLGFLFLIQYIDAD